jgi:CheY-like chemotaxis protein
MNKNLMVPLPENVVILLVDDSADDAFIMKRGMTAAEMRNQIIHINEAEGAIAYLQGVREYCDRSKFPVAGLVLLDLKMPRMDGFEVLAWIRQQPTLKELPVIVLTSSELLFDVTRAYELGANSYLVKPLEFENLEALIRTMSAVWRQATVQRGPPPEAKQ